MRYPPERAIGPRVSACCVALLGLAAGPVSAAPNRTGEQIYRQDCARCHGPAGEGTEEYPRALAGDRSVPQLSRLVAKTMPEDDPGTCTGEDADKVSAFVHEAFYSQVARERNKPPRVELSRLTVRQYRNAVADLIGAFRSTGQWGDERGLRGVYHAGRRPRGGPSLDRVDPQVNFDFGYASPEPELMEGDEFSARWEGSLLAPESGDYEFTVRTEHAVRLFVNDPVKPLIDAFVKSGNDTVYRASVTLLGGRAYPVKLEYSKAKQGVDDSKTNKKRKPPAVRSSVVLEWKPPQRAGEVVPGRNLSPGKSPETFVVTTPFPPDDRSVGYERGTSVSKAWDQATTGAAIETAGYVVAHLKELADAGVGADGREKRLREFCRKFAERAFRRPLTDELVALYVDRQFREAKDPETAVKRSLLLALKSPRFLYREAGNATPDAYDVASRLSFGLWDSLPDAPLLEAAKAGRLATRDQVALQAERMGVDLRTHAKVREFLLQWLKVDAAPDVSKDPEKYPGFDAAVVSDLRTSLELFLDDVVWGEASDFRRLLLDDALFLNGRLAKVYGASLPDDAPFSKVKLDSGERAGVLSHPYLLSTFAYTATSSPIHRGVFLSRSVLGRSLRPPPVAVAPLAPSLHAGLTTRERVALQTSPAACMSCHGMINPLGFSLERFDAIGRYRAEEKGRPVDASGAYEAPSGETFKFSGARDLASALAGSEEAHSAFVEQLFHYLVKQPIRAFGPRELSSLKSSFVASGFHVRKLLVEIMAESAAARDVKVTTPAAPAG